MRELKRHSATLSAWSLLARATVPACGGAGFLYIWSELKIGWADGELFLCLRALNIVAGVVVYIGLQVRGARQAAAKVMLTVLGTFYVLNMVDAAASPTELLVARYTKVTEDFRALGAFVNMTVGIMAASQPLSTLHLAAFIVTISFLSIVGRGRLLPAHRGPHTAHGDPSHDIASAGARRASRGDARVESSRLCPGCHPHGGHECPAGAPTR